MVGACQQATIANNLKFQITYRIPLVNPCIGEPLRTLMLLPIHRHPQDPVLSIDFEAAANMYSAGSLSALSVEVVLIRRAVSQAQDAAIVAAGGYIPFDLMESANVIPLGVSQETRFPLATPGSYLNLVFRQYLGGASVTRSPVDAVTTFGSESVWRLETGGNVLHQWRWKHLRAINQFTSPENSTNQTYSPRIGGVVAAGTLWTPAASVMLDWLGDGLTGDASNELGSVLDCNLPTLTGLKMEVVGTPASVATNASTLFIGGHRLYGDLSQWQKFNL
jgi:hypothetical protein